MSIPTTALGSSALLLSSIHTAMPVFSALLLSNTHTAMRVFSVLPFRLQQRTSLRLPLRFQSPCTPIQAFSPSPRPSPHMPTQAINTLPFPNLRTLMQEANTLSPSNRHMLIQEFNMSLLLNLPMPTQEYNSLHRSHLRWMPRRPRDLPNEGIELTYPLLSKCLLHPSTWCRQPHRRLRFR